MEAEKLTPDKPLKPRPRLGPWFRLGIVLSLIWMVGGYWYNYALQADDAARFAEMMRKVCEGPKDASLSPVDPIDVQRCWDEWPRHYQAAMEGTWKEALFSTVSVLLAAWAAALLTVRSVRWVLAGRAAPRK